MEMNSLSKLLVPLPKFKRIRERKFISKGISINVPKWDYFPELTDQTKTGVITTFMIATFYDLE